MNVVDIRPCKVNRDRKITIPFDIAQKYNIKEGDTILLLDKDSQLRMVSQEEYLGVIQ